METTGVGGPGAGQSTTIHVRVDECTPSFLPSDGHGGKKPFELFALREFYESRGGHPSQSESVTTEGALLSLPSLSALDVPPDRWIDSLEVAVGGYGRHAFACVSLGWPLFYECGMVFRPDHSYAFVASFLHCLPPTPTEQRRRNCYHVHCIEGIPPPAEVQTAVSAIVRSELDGLCANRVSPRKPHMGDLRPLLRTSTRRIAGGAVEIAFEFRAKTRGVVIDDAKLASLEGPARRASIAAVQSSLRTTRGKRGARPLVPPKQLRSAYRQLVPLCEALLFDLPRAPWPPFETRGEAEMFLRSKVRGSDPELRAIARVLTTGRRCPNARGLAIAILERWLGVSKDWLRRLTRD